MLLLLLLIFPIFSYAQNWESWNPAKIYYDKKSYSQALEELLKNPLYSPNYFFNLGILFYHLEELGKARAYLEKASSLKPQDLEIQKNLSWIQAQWKEKYGELDHSTLELETLFEKLTPPTLSSFLGWIIFMISILGIKLYSKIRKSPSWIKNPYWVFLSFMIGLGFLFEFFFLRKISPPAFLLHTQMIRNGPGEDYMELTSLPTGSKVRCLNQLDSWVQIRYSKQGIGWVPQLTLLTL